MSDIYVNLPGLKSQSDELHASNVELKELADAVITIQKNLGFELASKSGVINKLNKIEAGIMKEATNMENLSKALIYIAQTYEKTENKIIDEANGTRSVFQKIQDFIEDIKKSIYDFFGIDDIYYRKLIGYEYFDTDKTREKLMDEYMQAKIFELMQTDRFSEETWNNASKAEREKILNEFLAKINAIMGTSITGAIVVNSDLSGKSARGRYCESGNGKNRWVEVNPDYLDGTAADSYMIMRTLVHEMRHAYQHEAVRNPDKFLVSEETRQQWADNFKDYKDAQTYGYDAYVTQAIEWDAKNFAKQYADTSGYTPVYEGSWG